MNAPHREYCRREHRVVGHYLAIQSWIRGLDCIVLDRHDLQFFFGLKRFKGIRVRWLIEDLEPWFQYEQRLFYNGGTLASLYLSRAPLDSFFPEGTMHDEERIRLMGQKPGSPKTGKFLSFKRPSSPPTKEQIISHLALISCGLDFPKPYGSKRMKYF